MKQILYTGIGSKENGIHTEQEFLKIMSENYSHIQWSQEPTYRQHLCLKYKDWSLPDDFIFFSLNEWLEYSGADII